MRMYVMWIRMSDNAAVCCSIWRLYIRRLNICTDLFSNVQQATWDCLFLISALSSWVDHKSRRQDTSRRDSFSAFSEDNNPPLYLPSINVCHVSFKSWLRGHHIFFISKSRQIIVLPVPWPQWSQPSSRIEHPHKEMSMPHAINQHSVSHFHQDREREVDKKGLSSSWFWFASIYILNVHDAKQLAWVQPGKDRRLKLLIRIHCDSPLMTWKSSVKSQELITNDPYSGWRTHSPHGWIMKDHGNMPQQPALYWKNSSTFSNYELFGRARLCSLHSYEIFAPFWEVPRHHRSPCSLLAESFLQ